MVVTESSVKMRNQISKDMASFICDVTASHSLIVTDLDQGTLMFVSAQTRILRRSITNEEWCRSLWLSQSQIV